MRPAGLVAAALIATVAACDPIWSVEVGVRAPTHAPIADVTVAFVCPNDERHAGMAMAAATDGSGVARVSGMGFGFPIGCDVYLAKVGYETLVIPYAALCPQGDGRCDRTVRFDRILAPHAPAPPPGAGADPGAATW